MSFLIDHGDGTPPPSGDGAWLDWHGATSTPPGNGSIYLWVVAGLVSFFALAWALFL